MATIKAFRGMRFTPKAGDISALICPPYDVIDPQMREDICKENPYNIVRLELPAGGDDKYAEAGELLEKWQDDGILALDETPGIYVYEIEFKDLEDGLVKRVKGFVAAVKLEEFAAEIILPHEETLSKAKADRFNLMSETFANFSQIYSLYMDDDGTFELVEKCSKGEPTLTATCSDGVIHRLWYVTDEKAIAEITTKFNEKKLYIADGHHRYETALKFDKEHCGGGGDVMMMLVNMENSGLAVYPTHRIVRGLAGFDLQKVLEKSAKYFEIDEVSGAAQAKELLAQRARDGANAFAVYDGNFTVLTLKNDVGIEEIAPGKSAAYAGLDVAVLHNLLLELALGIDKENMAAQKNLTYTKSFEQALAAVDEEGANCAVIMNATKVSQIRDVSLQNEKMPQKSTYFYPKLSTGLVMRKITI